MKKRVGFVSLLLALTLVVNAVTPTLSVTLRNAFSSQPQLASVMDSAGDSAAANEVTARLDAEPKEAAYEDGKILIYNYAQLSMIGSGQSYQYEDGVTVVYALDAAYKLARDIPVPRHTLWQLPDGFKGTITGDKQSEAPLYDAQRDSIYLYHPYQLAVLAADDRDSQPVMSGDADASTFGSGKVICTDEANKVYLTYSEDRNYVVSAQFHSEVPEKPVSVRSKMTEESVGAAVGSSVGASPDGTGRDFDGQVLKEIDGVTYILIGNEAQLRAIGTDAKVWTRAYSTRNGTQKIIYGGDADLAQEHNGYADFTFHQISANSTDYPRAGVNQETGAVYTDSLHVDNTSLGTAKSWETDEKYTIDANYIVFRSFDLGGQDDPWTPLMFSGTMYGAESADGTKLWNGDENTPTTALTATAAVNRPKISGVYVNQTAELVVNNYIGIGFFATISNKTVSSGNGFVSGGTAVVKNLELQNVHVENHATTAKVDQTLVNALLSGVGAGTGALLDVVLGLLSFGQINNNNRQTMPTNLLNARTTDPTIFATGAFAGRIYGDVLVEDCVVSGTVSVSNIKDRTGGFVGYTEGVARYSALSGVLGAVVNGLAEILNLVPAVGLGDLITILLGEDGALDVGNLLVVGYYNPKIVDSEVSGLTGDLGSTLTSGQIVTAVNDFVGGFIGQQIGTQIKDCRVVNSTYHVYANRYGGGFSGLTRDAEIKGTLDTGLGINLAETLLSLQPQSTMVDCSVSACHVQATGNSCLGGFVGAMTNSYAVDCTVDCPGDPLTVTAVAQYDSENNRIDSTGEYAGGFAGYMTAGWEASLGKDETNRKNLVGTLTDTVKDLLQDNPSVGQKLLTLQGAAPSSAIGCQIYSQALTVHADFSSAGGFVGRGEGAYIAKSDQEAFAMLASWNAGEIKTIPEEGQTVDNPILDRQVAISQLSSVTAGSEHQKNGSTVIQGDYAGGVAGYITSVAFQGLLNETLGLGNFIDFTVRDVTLTGVNSGYTVETGHNAAGGGFGVAVGGAISNVKLNKLSRVQANNRAAGFVAEAGPGDLAGSSGGITVNLLGLNNVIQAKSLLSLGALVEVTIDDSDVTGIDDGYTVEAVGSDANAPSVAVVAAGFIADSNSTKITNSHAYQLLSVKAPAENGYAGGYIGSSETGGLAEAAGNDSGNITNLLDTDSSGALVSVDGLLNAISYLIPEYTNCTTNFVDGGLVDADIAGGFVADFVSGTVDNTTINTVDAGEVAEINGESVTVPKWTHTMKELNDPDAVNATGDLNKQFAVINIDRVYGRTYGGGFGGKLYSGALADAGKGVSILGGLKSTSGISLDVGNLLSILNTYVPYVKHAGVYSKNGFTVEATEVRAGDLQSGSAGGFGGYVSGAQITECDVYQLKHTTVNPPEELETANAPSYYDDSAYAVTGGRLAGGYVGVADVGSAASVGGIMNVLDVLDFSNVASALSVVVTTIEHSDVQGAPGGFSVLANGTDNTGKVGKAGGFAGEIAGAHIQNSHCKNFYYIIGQEAAGGYLGSMKPGDVAKLFENASVLSMLADIDGSLLSLVEDFVPTIRNSTTSCVPCGGAVRADASSDSGHQRGCAGGYCGHNEGGHIWGLDTHTWQDQNDGVVSGRYFGHDREGEYTGEQHIAAAWRIRSVYGAEYAGGFTGFMEAADTAGTGNISLLSGIVQVDDLLSALSVVYPTETNTAVYGPLRNIDSDTWDAWVTYVGKYGGYGLELATQGISGPSAKYYYGCNVVAGRSTVCDTVGNDTVWPVTEGGDAGGYVGLMRSGVITNGQSYDMKEIRAMRSAGGYAGSMQTGGVAELGQAGIELFGLNLQANLGKLVSALGEVFVPSIHSGSVRGWQSGLTVTADGIDRDPGSDGLYDTNQDITYRCGYAGGYVGSAYGAQILGDQNVGDEEGTGCNVVNLRYVRGNNAAGGYAGIATAASMAEVNTHASQKGLLEGVLESAVQNNDDLASVLQATVTKIKQAQVDPDSSDFGFVVEGVSDTPPRYAGGFAGQLEASFVGVDIGDVTDELDENAAIETNIVVNGLRSVNAIYDGGGFFGLADVTGVANVSGSENTNVLGSALSIGEISVIDAFRSYVYFSEVNGVEEGIIVRVHNESSEATLGETRVSGCAGGFGGAMMNGTVKYSKVTNLSTVYGKNYSGGFIGHMGKSGVVDADNASVASLVGLTAGVFDVFSTHTDRCEVDGIADGAVIMATNGTEPIAGGFAGYADVSKITDGKVEALKQVYSDEIAGGFVGKTDMHYLISVDANSPLVTAVEGILNLLLRGLRANDLSQINLASLDLGIVGLELLQDGDLVYLNLLGLRVGVSLLKDADGNVTDTALVTIGDSYIELPYDENGFDFNSNSSAAVINLIKGNRTRVEDSSVKGISIGYDVYGGGAGNDHDGSGAKGMAGGFVGFNHEGHLLNNSMEFCDVVRGAPQLTGSFSGNTSLQSVYSFNSLASIEGENNTYAVYRRTSRIYALTRNNQQIGSRAVSDSGYMKFTVVHLAEPLTQADGDTAYYQIFEKWQNAKLAAKANGSDSKPIGVYASSAKAVLMLDKPTEPNVKSLVPNPGEDKDPCEKTMKLTVQKVWNDHDNGFGARPASIRVRIMQSRFDANGDPITVGTATQVPYTDAAVIPDADANGWFTITQSDERSDSSTWTRVIDGLPVYTSDPDTYYTYTVEEDSVEGYTTEISYNETELTSVATTAKIVNTKKIELQFKYYDRYLINGTAAGISSDESTYSVSIDTIPKEYLTFDSNSQFVSAVDFAGLIGSKAVEFSESSLAVNNVMCDYDLWTSQQAAVEGMAAKHYYVNGVVTPYQANEVIHHTNYLGEPQSTGENWVNYYDQDDNKLEESFRNASDYVKVSKIVVWCYNYPKQYDVNIFGAESEEDLNLTPKVVAGNEVYVADPISVNEAVKYDGKFYYNQRFGEATGNASQDDEGFIKNYGIPGSTGVQPADYTAEAFDGYTFVYWAYDPEGTQIASVDRNFKYRITTDTKLYAVYATDSIAPGISISANSVDTYVNSSGVSRTRLNILGSVYGASDYDPDVNKLALVNISLSDQIRSRPDIYTPNKINALFEQYKAQLTDLIVQNDAQNGSKSFTSDVTYNGGINETNGEVVDTLNLTLTTKGYIFTVTSNGQTALAGESTIKLSNKNRVQFTLDYSSASLNVNNSNEDGNVCQMYCAAVKYSGDWKLGTNCLIYYNGNVVQNTSVKWE